MKFERKLWVVLISISTLFGTLSPAAFGETGVTDKEILVATLNGMSGPNEFYGKCTNTGVDALLNWVNDHGGVYGRKIRCIHEDDKYEPIQGVECFNDALAKGVFAFTGIAGTPPLAKYLLMCMSNKVPLVGSYSAPSWAYEPVRRYFFGDRCSYGDEVTSAVDHLWNDVGARRIAVIYQDDAFGANLLNTVKAALKKHDAEIVAEASYIRNQNNVAQAAANVKRTNPDGVILAAAHQPAAEVLKMAHDTNWHPVFVLNSACAVDKLVEEAGNDSDGQPISETAPVYTTSELKLVVGYKKAMEKYFPNEKPNFVSLKGYIAALIFVEGLKRAGKNLTREGFIDALESMHNVDIGMGRGMELNYSPTDHRGFSELFWMTTKDGQLVSMNPWKKLAKK